MIRNRQLAAIMFTDIVGYTAMMQQDEKQAVTAIKRHKAIIEQAVPSHQGDLIEFYGDGSLSVFSSVTEALQCAVSIQWQMQVKPAIPLRIGIHTGEILFEAGKVMGDGVNIASRLQALGSAGSILFSREVMEKIRNHPEYKPVALGVFNLKNVTNPMDVYALSGNGLKVPDIRSLSVEEKPSWWSTKAARRLLIAGFIVLGILLLLLVVLPDKHGPSFTGQEKSIAVLPFDNIGNDTLQDYFSDGITEDIITQLSKIADLKVISRTSVMQYKNSEKNIREIADELHVSAILEGSVRKVGNNLRINAQLIDANTDQHIWAEQYDRDASEVFAIQTEVAEKIAAQMNARLTAEEGLRIGKKATSNMEAYEYYLKAKKSPPWERVNLLKKALQEDSTFALAWAELAHIYSFMLAQRPEDKPAAIRKSLDAALTALHYGPDLSETHMNMGDVLKTITLNPELSIRELKESIRLNTNNAEAYVYLAYALMELGRFEEAESNMNIAKQLDPLSEVMWSSWIRFYRYSRQPQQLMDISRFAPTRIKPYFLQEVGYWYHFLQNNGDSMMHYATSRELPWMKGIALSLTGRTDDARKLADSLIAKSPYDYAFSIGIIYAWAGNKDKAVEYLNLAYRLYDYQLINIRVDKVFDPLREEPGFKELLKRMDAE